MYEERRGGHNKTHESTKDFDYIDSFWTLGKIAYQLYESGTAFNLDDLSIEYVNKPFGERAIKFFYCPICKKRVRHLYIYRFNRFIQCPEDFELKCRKCANLNYPSQQKRGKERLIGLKAFEKFNLSMGTSPCDYSNLDDFLDFREEQAKKKEKPPSQKCKDKALRAIRQIQEAHHETNIALNTINDAILTLKKWRSEDTRYDISPFYDWLENTLEKFSIVNYHSGNMFRLNLNKYYWSQHAFKQEFRYQNFQGQLIVLAEVRRAIMEWEQRNPK